MFKLVNDLAFWWPVTVVEPDTDEPGEVVEHTFEAQFVVLDRDETRRFADIRKTLLAEAIGTNDPEKLDAIEEKLDDNEIASIRRALRNWRSIVDHADKPIVFDETTFAAAMKHDRVRNGFLRAYQKAVTQEKGRIKKLTEAAAAWAYAYCGRSDPKRASVLDEDMAAQFKQMGVAIAPGQVIESEAAEIGIMTCNWSSFEAFRACDTQWRFSQIGDRIVYVGLDYPACRLVLDDIGAGREVFSDLREMERAVLPILNDQVGGNEGDN